MKMEKRCLWSLFRCSPTSPLHRHRKLSPRHPMAVIIPAATPRRGTTRFLVSLLAGTIRRLVGFPLQSNFISNLNTAIGAGTLLSNTGDDNTATGAGALLNNTTGVSNTAAGVFAVFDNTTGSSNTATGFGALGNNTSGNSNTAYGANALLNNTTAGSNTTIG